MPIIAVTGASGFIGRRLVAALDDAGYDVRALSTQRAVGGSAARRYRLGPEAILRTRDAPWRNFSPASTRSCMAPVR